MLKALLHVPAYGRQRGPRRATLEAMREGEQPIPIESLV